MNELDNPGFKGQLLWQPSSDLSVTFSGDYTHQDPIGYRQVWARTGSTQRPLNRQYAALAAASNNYRPPSFDPFDRLTDLDSPLTAKQRFGGASVLAEWNVGRTCSCSSPGFSASSFTHGTSGYIKLRLPPRQSRDLLSDQAIAPEHCLKHGINGHRHPPSTAQDVTPMRTTAAADRNVISLDDYRWQPHCRRLYQLPIAA